jgi:SAM-dependent methyltransferase
MKTGFFDWLKAPAANLYDYANYMNVLKFCDPCPHDRVLDVGCGIGILEYVLNGKVEEIIGIDISMPSIEFLNHTFPSKNVKFFCYDILQDRDYPFEAGFDKIACIDVLEHIEKPRVMIDKVYDLLNENGKAVITFPVNNPSHGHYITPDMVEGIVKGIPGDYNIKYFRARKSILNSLYCRIRNLFPLREGDSFDNTISYDLLLKQQRNMIRKFMYNSMKAIIVMFAEIIGNTFYEVDSKASRCCIIIKKGKELP